MTNEILQRKIEAQKCLSEQAGYDLHRYAQLAHESVRKLGEKYGLKFRYGDADMVSHQPEIESKK